jgi:hypothetical protein
MAQSTDRGRTWVKHPEPVLGLGRGGVDWACRNRPLKIGARWYLFFNCIIEQPAGSTLGTGHICVAYNDNPLGGDEWIVHSSRADGRPSPLISPLNPNPNGGQNHSDVANSTVWIEPDGRWCMAYDSLLSPANPLNRTVAEWNWVMHYGCAGPPPADLRGPAWNWEYGRGMTGLGQWTYGGPYVVLKNGRYHMWYHATAESPEGTHQGIPAWTGVYHVPPHTILPSDIFYATAAQPGGPWKRQWPPLLTHQLKGYEFDQVADPHVIETSWGEVQMYYDGDDNRVMKPGIRAAIGLAIQRAP